jgi:hypothetical protein
MVDRVRKSDLLIIKGVFKADFKGEKSVYSGAPTVTSTCKYISLPTVFRDVTVWKHLHTNLKCWECDLSIGSYPKFIPRNPRVENVRDVCDVDGAFCEWGCVVRYISKFDKQKFLDTLRTVCLFESKFTGKYREYIAPAPSKTSRKEYCGESGLSVKEFRDKCAQVNNDYQLMTFKVEHL